jgi:hypothetical protein
MSTSAAHLGLAQQYAKAHLGLNEQQYAKAHLGLNEQQYEKAHLGRNEQQYACLASEGGETAMEGNIKSCTFL